MFQVNVPLAQGQVLATPSAQETPVFATRRGMVLVIDDDTIIQSAMRGLLSSWGHDVIVAGSGAEMLDRIVTLTRRPDLILCDYRLRDGENGIGAIKRLQSQYTEDVFRPC